jgi:hypothetical protein
MIGPMKRDRPVALDGHAVSLAFVRPVIPDGMMHRAAVVPECHVVALPAVTDLKLELLAVIEQKVEQHVAFAIGELVDSRRERAIHVQRLPARVGMRPHDRV